MTPLTHPMPAEPLAGPTIGPTRRRVLAAGLVSTALGLGAAVPARAAIPARGPGGRSLGPLSVRGGDISFTLQEEAAGKRLTDPSIGHGRPQPIERILAAHGANWVRLRVWVNPPAGYSTLNSALTLARRAKRVGMKVLVDPHYSDFWADPAKQPIPAGWPTDTVAALARKVRSYTRDLVWAFARQGTPVDMIQIGNEVTNGMLWPLGQLYRSDGAHWSEFATLVKAGIAGVRDGTPPDCRPRTMVHIDKGGENAASRYFFDNLFAQGVDVDVLGQSYYAMWHGSLADLSANLNDLATRYGRDVLIAETQYPWTLTNGDDLSDFVWQASQMPDGATYPATPAGQAGYYEALRRVLSAVPGGHGAGFLVWEPEWIPGVGWEPGSGNPNDNMTLFDFNGAALPALAAMRPPRR